MMIDEKEKDEQILLPKKDEQISLPEKDEQISLPEKDEQISLPKKENMSINLAPKIFEITSVFNSLDMQKFDEIQRVAKLIASSDFVPDLFRKNIPNTVMVLDLSISMKVPVFILMNNIFHVYGKIGFSSSFIISLINSCGKFETLQFEYFGDDVNDDNYGCRAFTAHKRTQDKILYGPKITIKTAKNEGWYHRKGSKWPTMPKLMLTYRAATFWSRIFHPINGIQSIEEIKDIYSNSHRK